MMQRRRTAPVFWLLAFVLSAGLVVPAVGAQDAKGEVLTSEITRDEYYQQVWEHYDLVEPATEGGQFIIADISDITTTNAILADNDPTLAILIGPVFQTLWGISVIDGGEPVPGLADSWEIAPDRQTYTFFLNQDVTWHDGTPFTAEDVEFSFDRQLDPASGSSYTSFNAENIESYRMIDEYTFELVAREPLVAFLLGEVYVPIIPKHIWESVPPEEMATDPGSTGQDPARVVGTGPFRFVEWIQGDSVRLVRNEDYWDPNGVPTIDEVILRVLPDDSTAIQSLITGEIDAFEVVPPGQIEDVENNEGTSVAIYDTLDFGFYGTNLDPERTTLFQDVEVRQALLTALDRDLINETIYQGLGETAYGPQPILSIAYAPDRMENRYEFDPERARELLAEAGWVDEDGDGVVEKDGERLSFELTTTEGVAAQTQLLAYMQEAWADIGVDMTPNFVPFPTLLEMITETYEFEAVLLGFSWDVSGSQGAMFGCDAYEGGFNFVRYCNEEYDRLEALQQVEFDQEARIEIMIEQANIINNELPISIIRFSERGTGYNDSAQNFHPNGYGFLWSLPFVWIEE